MSKIHFGTFLETIKLLITFVTFSVWLLVLGKSGEQFMSCCLSKRSFLMCFVVDRVKLRYDYDRSSSVTEVSTSNVWLQICAQLWRGKGIFTNISLIYRLLTLCREKTKHKRTRHNAAQLNSPSSLSVQTIKSTNKE